MLASIPLLEGKGEQRGSAQVKTKELPVLLGTVQGTSPSDCSLFDYSPSVCCLFDSILNAG